MDLLADENLDGPIVAWLREQGHDVLWMAESLPGADDAKLLELASAQERLLITLDRDFGDLIFRRGMRPPGAILLRLRTRCASELLRAFQEVWPIVELRAPDHLVVVSPGKVRVRPLWPKDFP